MSPGASRDRLSLVRDALAAHEGPLLRYARRLVGNTETARDVVQETFLRLCREDPGRLNGCLREWLYTVCRNHAFDVRRKDRRMTTMSLVESPPERPAERTRPAAAPEPTAEARESSGIAMRMVNALPENQQDVIRLRFQAGLSYKEIAAVTGLSVTNVGFLLHTAIKTIRERMTP
jgi:RNA polymerase sigma-70 factor (ECF subfamily)